MFLEEFQRRVFLCVRSSNVSFSCQELGKTWEEVQSEDDRELVDDEDE